MRGLPLLATAACGWAAATRVYADVRHEDLLQELEALRSEVERLRGRVRVLEYEKEVDSQNDTVAASVLEAWGASTNLRRSLGKRALVVAASQASNVSTEGEPEPWTGDHWGVSGVEGGSDKFTEWRNEKGGGWGSLICAVLFIGVFGSAPLVHSYALGTKAFTRVHVIESMFLYTWLSVGIIVFTQHIEFQSPHFSQVRTLSIEEAVYLVAQIVTTVGYGDITPAHPYGQVFVGFFVFLAIMLAGQMISELTQLYEERIGGLLRKASRAMEAFSETVSVKLTSLRSSNQLQLEAEKADEVKLRRMHAVWTAAVPMMHSALAFSFFTTVGATFFVMFPGENKTPLQAVYMSLITLSTVGFGAFTPNTHGGMVFSAFWMLFGVASLASLVSSRAAFALALRKYEAGIDDSSSEAADHNASESSEEESRMDPVGRKGVQEQKAEQKAQDAGGTLHSDSEVMTCPHCGKPSVVPK
mmetsp:Transcript_29877/g.85334  ORF Transcript_29877/g.85334 Transcript_29877/m.85334 type:complete len:472 (+) Transcript_29877:110-1525(+)